MNSLAITRGLQTLLARVAKFVTHRLKDRAHDVHKLRNVRNDDCGRKWVP